MRLLLTALLALGFLAGCASTADVYDGYDYDVYDRDRDGYLTGDEFATGFGATPYYADYDLDDDGYLNEDEFYGTGFGYDYDAFDLNDDGLLDDDEFYGGVYNEYDLDNDGLLDENEFGAGYGATFGV